MTTKTPLAIDCHSRKIWIDLDNSPHVPFFVPIIEELKQRGHKILLTARDNAQVLGLVDYYHLDCKRFGHHYGKNKLFKVLGIGTRALQLAPLILREKPDLALSHGSRTQIVLTSLLGIPSIIIFDYEYANQGIAGFRPKWVMVPEVISDSLIKTDHSHVLRYPGIKEDVYVPRFRPDPEIRQRLGLDKNDLVVTVRPPASDAHYHNPMSDVLFRFVVEFLSQNEAVRMVLLPRNDRQAISLRREWSELFSSGKIRIPEQVMDGLNLMWFSDLVISGGGTMNREAAALGVPVYSIFCGKIGAVDQYLAAQGRLTLLEHADDVRNKVRLVRRKPTAQPDTHSRPALDRIVENVAFILERETRSN
jgi:hypothetical protein